MPSTEICFRCKHYNRVLSRDHLINFDVGSGSYDLEYLEALSKNNVEDIEFIESNAELDGYGPLAPCLTIVNFSSQRIDCRATFIFISFGFCYLTDSQI